MAGAKSHERGRQRQGKEEGGTERGKKNKPGLVTPKPSSYYYGVRYRRKTQRETCCYYLMNNVTSPYREHKFPLLLLRRITISDRDSARRTSRRRKRCNNTSQHTHTHTTRTCCLLALCSLACRPQHTPQVEDSSLSALHRWCLFYQTRREERRKKNTKEKHAAVGLL